MVGRARSQARRGKCCQTSAHGGSASGAGGRVRPAIIAVSKTIDVVDRSRKGDRNAEGTARRRIARQAGQLADGKLAKRIRDRSRKSEMVGENGGLAVVDKAAERAAAGGKRAGDDGNAHGAGVGGAAAARLAGVSNVDRHAWH